MPCGAVTREPGAGAAAARHALSMGRSQCGWREPPASLGVLPSLRIVNAARRGPQACGRAGPVGSGAWRRGKPSGGGARPATAAGGEEDGAGAGGEGRGGPGRLEEEDEEGDFKVGLEMPGELEGATRGSTSRILLAEMALPAAWGRASAFVLPGRSSLGSVRARSGTQAALPAQPRPEEQS